MDNLSTGAQQVLDALNQIEQGTVAEIRERTGKTNRVTDKAVRELAAAGLIVETDSGDGNPARWSITTPTPEPTTDTAADAEPGAAAEAQPDAATDQLDTATDAGQDEAVDPRDGEPAETDLADAGQPDPQDETPAEDDPAAPADEDGRDDGSRAPAGDAATETEQVPSRPKPPADRKVLAVAGVLGDYPGGATIDDIADACGFNVGVVARLLLAMEQADAARRIPADDEAGTPERWQPGPGKASEVDPNPAPPRCPTCGQVIRNSMPKTATATPRSTGTANTDGNEPLGRGVLRGWVAEFINAHPGHELTPGTITEALGAQHGRTISSGAVLNNCRALAMNGQIRVVRQEPFTVTANKPADTNSEQQ